MLPSRVNPSITSQPEADVFISPELRKSNVVLEGTGIVSATLLAGCSGGAVDPDATSTVALTTKEHAKQALVTPLSASAASRFLSQAAFGGNDQDIAALENLGAAAWLENQFSVTSDQTHWDWLISHGFNAATDIKTTNGIDATLWRKLISSPDTVRQRVALALSEIFVVSLIDLPVEWRSFAVAAYMDMIAANAFGNFRSLLQAVTLSPAMGAYLGTRGNEKEDPATGREADENYAREVMQLFTIGLYELHNDGSVKNDGSGNPIPTYTPAMVTQLAQVFTGWNFDGYEKTAPDYLQRPMTLNAKLHSTSAKSFLGATIAEGTDGNAALKIALDTLFNHSNVPAFIGQQLIQRLVTSNPSPAYISRVAAIFTSGNGGVRGDMKSVISAVLLDPEAQTALASLSAGAGKLREPIIRLAQWARTFKTVSTSGNWQVGDTSNQGTRLGQSPMRSPTVFNFFRPGFVPPNGVLGNPALVAPELQITNESTVIGYANFMQETINGTLADLTPDYTTETAIAGNAAALFNRLNMLLAGGQLSTATATVIQNAINTISVSNPSGTLSRVKAAIMLIMCSPEYIVQK
jgi:uncharacterized protein (DUF1800 family)